MPGVFLVTRRGKNPHCAVRMVIIHEIPCQASRSNEFESLQLDTLPKQLSDLKWPSYV